MNELVDGVSEFLDSQEQFMIINGGAGTGKSYSVSYLLEHNILDKRFTVLTATTNKAAAVLAEKTNEATKTIYSLLKLIPFDNYETGKTTLKQTEPPSITNDIIIIDEVYMLTPEVLQYLFTAIEGTQIKVIGVGDSHQLPPVFYNKSPVENLNVRTITLNKIWRTDRTDIQDVGAKFRQSVDTLKFGKKPAASDNVHIYEAGQFMHKMVNAFKAEPDTTKVIGWTNKKTVAYNNSINKLLNGNTEFNKGDQVVNVTPVFNHGKIEYPIETVHHVGTVGTSILNFEGVKYQQLLVSGITVNVPIDNDQLVKIRNKFKRNKNWSQFFALKEFFTDIRHTYSSTVHRAQGSTHKQVFVDVHDIAKNRNINEVARLLYVACTRPSDELNLCFNTSNMENEVAMMELLKVVK